MGEASLALFRTTFYIYWGRDPARRWSFERSASQLVCQPMKADCAGAERVRINIAIPIAIAIAVAIAFPVPISISLSLSLSLIAITIAIASLLLLLSYPCPCLYPYPYPYPCPSLSLSVSLSLSRSLSLFNFTITRYYQWQCPRCHHELTLLLIIIILLLLLFPSSIVVASCRHISLETVQTTTRKSPRPAKTSSCHSRGRSGLGVGRGAAEWMGLRPRRPRSQTEQFRGTSLCDGGRRSRMSEFLKLLSGGARWKR